MDRKCKNPKCATPDKEHYALFPDPVFERVCSQCRGKMEAIKSEVKERCHAKYSKEFTKDRRKLLASMTGGFRRGRNITTKRIQKMLNEKGFYPQLQTIRADLKVAGWKIEGRRLVKLTK